MHCKILLPRQYTSVSCCYQVQEQEKGGQEGDLVVVVGEFFEPVEGVEKEEIESGKKCLSRVCDEGCQYLW